MSFNKWFVTVIGYGTGEQLALRNYWTPSEATDQMGVMINYYNSKTLPVSISLRNEQGQLIATIRNYETDNICGDAQQAGESSAMPIDPERKINQSIG